LTCVKFFTIDKKKGTCALAERQQDRTQKTRKKILSAARFLFDSQGYEQSSVDQIARRADVAKGSVFVHLTKHRF